MKLDAARAIIVGAPNTHLAEAARTVLALLDACDLDRTEAAEAHLSVQAEALAVAHQEAEASDCEARRLALRCEDLQTRLGDVSNLWRKMIAERDRLARELEEARQPDKDLYRLRALEYAAEQLRDAQPPTRAEARWMWARCVAYLTPHLEGPKLGS